MSDIKHMKIMSVTWNMGAIEPNCEQLDNLLQKDLAQHDMYLIASQEALRSIPMSVFNPSKDELNKLIEDYFAGRLNEQGSARDRSPED